MLSVDMLEKFKIYIFRVLGFSLYTLKRFKTFCVFAFRKSKKAHGFSKNQNF